MKLINLLGKLKILQHILHMSYKTKTTLKQILQKSY